MLRLIKSVRIAAGVTLLILGYLLIGGAVLSGCAKPPPPAPIAQVPESLRAKCPRPDPAGVVTVSDVLAFSIHQEAAISICETKKDAAVAIIDAANEAQKPKREWWRFGR